MIYFFVWLAVAGSMAGLYASKQGETPQSSILFGFMYATALAIIGCVLLIALIFLDGRFGWFS